MGNIRDPLNITAYDDYKAFLRKTLEDAASVKKASKSDLARAMSCQLSYLSRVINGDAHLTLEQAEAASRYFIFNVLDTSYFLALISGDRAATHQLKAYWKNEQKRLLGEKLQLKKRVVLEQPLTEAQMAIYYSDWIFSAVHVLASIPRFQTVEAMSTALQLPPKTVREAVRSLVSISLIERHNGRFRTTKTQMHLDKQSTLFKQHAVNWKLKSIENLTTRKEQDLHYVSAISLSRVDYLKAKSHILECIEKIRVLVKDSQDETAAVYLFDLFELEKEEI